MHDAGPRASSVELGQPVAGDGPEGDDMADELRKLELRIARLENQLRQGDAAQQPADISDEDLSTYLRVQDALQEAGSDKPCRLDVIKPCRLEINFNFWLSEGGVRYRRFTNVTGAGTEAEVQTPGEAETPSDAE
jgi:hypothetical protein